jgi:predicted NBD/HSP70 family sugar kinase
VLDSIRRHGPISRVEIADASGLSRSAVTGVVQGLQQEGWIRELPDVASGDPGRGRPRVNLDMNPGAAHVLGVKLSLHRMSVAVTDFRGDVLHTTTLPFNGGQHPDIAADLIELGVRRCLLESEIDKSRVLGLCVAIPGYINNLEGLCYWSPIFDRDNVAFGALLAERFPFPTSIENDANMVTLAEHWFGEGKNLSNFAVVTVEHGIGMGLVTHDRLYRGHNGIGPEFGHSKIEFSGRACRCGQMGCVEAYASDYAILRQVLPHFSLDSYRQDPKAYHVEIERITAEAKAGDEVLAAEFAKAGGILGRAIGNLIATLNPSKVIVTGEGLRAGDMLFAPLVAEARKLQLAGNPFATDIVAHLWGDDVWARGAAALVLQQAYMDPATPFRDFSPDPAIARSVGV